MPGRHRILADLHDWGRRLARALDPSKPVVDVLESDSEVVVVAEIPGAGRDSLTLSVEGDEMALAARAEDVPEWRTLRVERCAGEWRRRFRLRGVDAGAAEARLADGLLVIRLPKRPGLARRQVDIQPAP